MPLRLLQPREILSQTISSSYSAQLYFAQKESNKMPEQTTWNLRIALWKLIFGIPTQTATY